MAPYRPSGAALRTQRPANSADFEKDQTAASDSQQRRHPRRLDIHIRAEAQPVLRVSVTCGPSRWIP